MPAVSVIIPVYNVEAYVDRCLKSVTGQSFSDIEIIIINDGSTDGSGERCLEWAKQDDRIVYVSKKNEGAGPARNLGIQMAQSEFVAFCDSDDWYDDQYVEVMFAKQKETDADIVACGRYRYDGNLNEVVGTIIPSADDVQTGQWTHWPWKLVNTMCAKIIRKSIFIDNDIKMPPIPGEDTAVQYFILTIAKKVAVIERPLYYYYFNRSGSQNNSHRRYTEYMVQMLTYGWYLFKKAGLFEKYKELLFIESLANISQWYPRIKDDAVYSEKWLADCSRAINSCFGDIMMRSPLRGAKRIVGYGALGKSAARLLPLLKDSPLYPTELWDVRGDGVDVFKPDFHSLSENDVLLCFPVGNIEKELKECFKKLNCLTLYASDIDLWFGYWKIFGSLIE